MNHRRSYNKTDFLFPIYLVFGLFLMLSCITLPAKAQITSGNCIPGTSCTGFDTRTLPLAEDCIPGLPCSDYDVNTDPYAGVRNSLNGPKRGSLGNLCDGNLMNQMLSRAFLHAERDTLMAQSLIRKPDSVLEYTCFDQFLAIAGEYAPTFSETTDWANRVVDRDTETEPDSNPVDFSASIPSGHLYNLLQLFLLPPLEPYITSNFSHTFNGGAIPLDHTLNFSALGPPTYACDQMQLIWNITKCTDFGEEDQFWSFEQLVNIDPRVLPDDPNPPYEACSPGYEPPGPIPATTPDAFGIEQVAPCQPDNPTSPPEHDTTEAIIRVSQNCDFIYVIFDWLDYYFELFRAPGDYPNSATPTVTCRPPLPTGVTVTTYEYTRVPGPNSLLVIDKTSDTHPDAVCINPGCYYDATTNECVEP